MSTPTSPGTLPPSRATRRGSALPRPARRHPSLGPAQRGPQRRPAWERGRHDRGEHQGRVQHDRHRRAQPRCEQPHRGEQHGCDEREPGDFRGAPAASRGTWWRGQRRAVHPTREARAGGSARPDRSRSRDALGMNTRAGAVVCRRRARRLARRGLISAGDVAPDAGGGRWPGELGAECWCGGHQPTVRSDPDRLRRGVGGGHTGRVQLWASRHQHSGLVALSITAEPTHPARGRSLPILVRVVDTEVGEAAQRLARADADAARAAGQPIRIDLDQLVARASTSPVGSAPDERP